MARKRKKRVVTTRTSGLTGIDGIVLSIIDRAVKDIKVYKPGHMYHETAKQYFESDVYKSDLHFLGLDEKLLPTILRGEKNE